MTDYNDLEDKFMFNLTEDIFLTMEDAGVTKEKASEHLGCYMWEFEDFISGEYYMSIEEILKLCHLCGAEIDVVITRNGKNVREELGYENTSGH